MPTNLYEQALEQHKPSIVIGVDEVGVGAWAGPVYVAAVMFGAGFQMEGLADSKKLSASKREDMFKKISPFSWVTRWFDPVDIDSLGIASCVDILNKTVVGRLSRLAPPEEYLVVFDGTHASSLTSVCTGAVNAIALPKADTYVPAVMAASIMAKVTRDGIMRKVPDPGYGYKNHMGYGTKEHTQALAELGPSEFHRFSYRPVADTWARQK